MNEMSGTTSTRPTLTLDLFSDEATRDCHCVYREIRDLAPAVWLERHSVWALGRFADVRAALGADDVLISSRGVGLNDFVNDQPGRTTLTSDGVAHRKVRKVLMKPMMPRRLAEARGQIDELSDALVVDLLARDSFDGIGDFARHLPVSIVSRLVGLPDAGRERMLEWAAAIFNGLGPMNERFEEAGPAIFEMLDYARKVDRRDLPPGGWAAMLFQAADRGDLEPGDVRGLLIDYIAPSLDTTLLAAGHMLYRLGSNPEQYNLVRADPGLIPAAVHESLRVGSPVRAFTRFAQSDYTMGEVAVPSGDRVLLLYGSANRDERHYADPDVFDVTRNPVDHLALGFGSHHCAGGHLAQLELESLLRAVVNRVERIKVGEPTQLMSNMLHGYASFEVSFR